jgi:hypothetical protein
MRCRLINHHMPQASCHRSSHIDPSGSLIVISRTATYSYIRFLRRPVVSRIGSVLAIRPHGQRHNPRRIVRKRGGRERGGREQVRLFGS